MFKAWAREPVDDALLERRDALALPELVRERDEQVFEGKAVVVPPRVCDAEPREVAEAVLDEQLAPARAA